MAFHNVPPNGFPDLPDMEEVEAVVKDVTNLKTSVAGLSEDVSDLNDNKANQVTIAPFFNPETAYEVGDLVYYNGLSYRCTNAHEGEWDADDFSATTIANELAEVKSGLSNLSEIVNRQNQVLDLTNVTEPRTNVKKYTFTGVDLDNKVIAINTMIPTYGSLDSRTVIKRPGINCKYYAEVTDENNNHWAANIAVGGDYVEVETLSTSLSPSSFPISLDFVIILNQF